MRLPRPSPIRSRGQWCRPRPWSRAGLLVAVVAAGCAAVAPSPPVDDSGRGIGVATADSSDLAPMLPENVATAVLMATALLESGDVEAALPYYRFAWEASDEDPATGERYVEAALRAGHPREALSVLTRMGQLDPADVDLGIQRGRLLLMLGEREKADEVSAQLLREHPEVMAALELRLDVLQVAGRLDEALAVVEELRRLEPTDPDLLVARGDLQMRAERPAEAETSWREALVVDPASLAAIDRLSDLLREQGRVDELAPLLEELIAAVGHAPAQQARLADVYLALGEPERAVDVLLPLAESGELEPHALLVLADLLDSVGRTGEAVDLLVRHVEDEELPPTFHRLLGELAMELERYDLAERHLRRALRLQPADGNAVVSLLLLMSQREPDLLLDPEAVGEGTRREFERLLGHAVAVADTGSVRQNFIPGAMLRRLEDHARARPLLERAARLDPDNQQVLYDLAIAQEGMDDFGAAAGTLETLVEMDPDDAHLLNFYGYLLADQGWQLDRAEEMIRRAVEQEPENGFYADSLGWVYYRQGRLEEALEELIRASNLVGDDPVVLEHLGDVLGDLGRPEDALRVYERARATGGEPERLDPKLEEMRRALREGS